MNAPLTSHFYSAGQSASDNSLLVKPRPASARGASGHVRQRSRSASEVPEGLKRSMLRMKAEEELRSTEESYVRDLDFVRSVRGSVLDLGSISAWHSLSLATCASLGINCIQTINLPSYHIL